MTTHLLRKWHTHLGLTRKTNPLWHRSRLTEELKERRTAKTRLARLSETSDVLFTVSRAAHDGYPIQFLPIWSRAYNGFARVYMLAKFTSRWSFYRVAAYCAGKPDWRGVREVVNPRKGMKLDEVAERHRIEKEVFRRVCGKLLWVWPVLP